MASLAPPDARLWQAIGARLAHSVEARLGPEVLAERPSNRAVPLRHVLTRARREAGALGRHSGLILKTDIRSCYGSITPAVVFGSLLDHAVGRSVAARAAGMLEAWGGEGYAGLPIGPAASAVVANAVLARVDALLRPARFLRWVDDYLIAVDRDRELVPAIERLDEALAEVGLERSRAKTSVLEGGRRVGWLGTSARG